VACSGLRRGEHIERFAVCTTAAKISSVLKGVFSTVQKIVIEIVIDFSERAVLVLKKYEKKSIIERTRLFQWNRLHYAENRHSPSRFFSGSGWSS